LPQKTRKQISFSRKLLTRIRYSRVQTLFINPYHYLVNQFSDNCLLIVQLQAEVLFKNSGKAVKIERKVEKEEVNEICCENENRLGRLETVRET
jgi:hypothetical protein